MMRFLLARTYCKGDDKEEWIMTGLIEVIGM